MDYHQLNDDNNRIILQSLIDDTEDEEVKKVISCFTIESTGAEIVKKMSQCHVASLKKTSQYLEIPEAQKGKLKANIISDLVDRLNALLMEMCSICGVYYNEDLQEKPLVRCILCQQGCHNACQSPIIELFDTLDEKQQMCRPFMCASCVGDHSKETTNESLAHAPKNKKSPTKDKHPQPDENIKNDEADVPGSPRSINGRVVQKGDGGDQPKEPPKAPEEDKSKVAICPVYKWGKCPKYEECKFRHPPRCRSWLEKGKCSYNRKCKYHHPPLCHNSVRERQCFNQECKFFHLKQTRRFKMEEEQPKSSLNLGNFETQFPRLSQKNEDQQATVHLNNQFNNNRSNHNITQPYASAVDRTQQNLNSQSNPLVPTSNSQVPIQPKVTKEDMSFLVLMIREILKEDIDKQMDEMKRKIAQISPQVQTQKQIVQQAQTLPLHVNPNLLNPNHYSLQVAPPQQASQ